MVQIVASEMRITKDGLGKLLEIEMEVLEGEYQGRKLFDRLNLVNANPTPVELAQRTLSSICRPTSKLQVQESEELHFIPFIADVKVVPSKNPAYGPSNKCRYAALPAPGRLRQHQAHRPRHRSRAAPAPSPCGGGRRERGPHDHVH